MPGNIEGFISLTDKEADEFAYENINTDTQQYDMLNDDIYDEDDHEDMNPSDTVQLCQIISSVNKRSRRKCSIKSCGCLRCDASTGCCPVCRYRFECSCHDCGYARGLEGVIGNQTIDQLNLSNNSETIKSYLQTEVDRISNLSSWRERYIDVKDRLENCIVDSTNIRRYQFKYKIGRGGKTVPCCSNGFVKFYSVSTGTLEKMCREIKAEKYGSVSSARLSGSTTLTSDEIDDMEINATHKFGFSLNTSMLMAVKGRNSITWEICRAWMEKFFKQESQPQPNRRGEYHLSQGLTKKSIWEKYVGDIKSRKDGSQVYHYQTFIKLWCRVFPHICCRKFMAVQGKCVECALLEYESSEAKTPAAQREVRELYHFHSIKYRQERQWYHNVREESFNNDTRLSQITDGMAQVHNAIPSYGNSGTSIAKVFDTHLQGLITHGRRFTLFRTFGNVGKGTNVAVFAWLCELENIIKTEGKLPDTIYLQIDGGPENANAMMLGLAELIVHRRLTKKIYVTRLPPGHTNEVCIIISHSIV